ncbi:MAG: NUDIX domain-containing protein, partial [Pararhodobacter sp.]
QAVAGTPLPEGVAALLGDHAVTRALAPSGETHEFPLFTARAGAQAVGLLVSPDPGARARLDLYEVVFGYDPVPVTVQTDAGPTDALIYLPRDGLWTPGPDWSLEIWAAAHGGFAAETAAEVMALLQHATPAQVLRRYPMLAAHVASRRRARAEPGPAELRRPASATNVVTDEKSTPYTWFFGVEEQQVRFRTFAGTMSEPVNRAAFVTADAVIVLPYDPLRDSVLLVEQFRFGPLVRGDSNPWTLEAIAGRVDAAETPEQAARREAEEEAQLTLGVLHDSGRYYPSPGAVTEYLYTYVALADLPADAVGIHGLDAEAEDIRTHIIPFDRLMALIQTGEVANGPLITSAYWLALNRERLRGSLQASA